MQVLANLPCCPWHGRRDEGPIFRAAIARDGCALRGLRTGSRCLETPPKVFCAELWLRAGLQSRPGGRVDNDRASADACRVDNDRASAANASAAMQLLTAVHDAGTSRSFSATARLIRKRRERTQLLYKLVYKLTKVSHKEPQHRARER